ncbi:MAG: three-Cys-motif partner protein TcmP [Chloroflexi bacterium]|nr:three-Cys-motif partner protein TcmP [Chloroflexota bacterium]
MPRKVGDWTRDKLKILSDYLPAYLTATTKALERIYIDAFAGPGLNVVEGSDQIIDGSPLIALKAQSFRGVCFDRLFFIERNPRVAKELEELVEREDKEHRASVFIGDVNEKLPEIIRKINPRTPTFVFLDTDGIEPRWTTIEAIAPWKTELLINFPLVS